MDAQKILEIKDKIKSGELSLAEGSLILVREGLSGDEVIKVLES